MVTPKNCKAAPFGFALALADLQGFDGGHTGQVLGEEGLVSGTEHELAVELVAE